MHPPKEISEVPLLLSVKHWRVVWLHHMALAQQPPALTV